MNFIKEYLNWFIVLAFAICVGYAVSFGIGKWNARNDVVIVQPGFTTNVGRVSSELVVYRVKVMSGTESSGFSVVKENTPSQYVYKLIEEAMGEEFSYDSRLNVDMVLVLETNVIYTGDKALAMAKIDTRSLVFHKGTTVAEILIDVNRATFITQHLYKQKHSYIEGDIDEAQ